MHRILAIGIILFMAAGLGMAQERPESPEAQKAQTQMEQKTFDGEISSIDEAANTLTVKTVATAPEAPPQAPGQSPAEMTFHLDDQTKITATGSEEGELELADLSEGAQVNVKYVESGGEKLAKTITVRSQT